MKQHGLGSRYNFRESEHLFFWPWLLRPVIGMMEVCQEMVTHPFLELDSGRVSCILVYGPTIVPRHLKCCRFGCQAPECQGNVMPVGASLGADGSRRHLESLTPAMGTRSQAKLSGDGARHGLATRDRQLRLGEDYPLYPFWGRGKGPRGSGISHSYFYCGMHSLVMISVLFSVSYFHFHFLSFLSPSLSHF